MLLSNQGLEEAMRRAYSRVSVCSATCECWVPVAPRREKRFSIS